MSRSKKLYTLIEFGTDKICALYGAGDVAGNPEVVAFAQLPSAGSVVKGSIQDYNAALKILRKVLETAEKSLPFTGDRDRVFFLMNGSGVSARQGEGTVMIYEDDHKVTREHADDAVTRAQSLTYAPDRVKFGVYDAYFLVDGTSRVKNPVGQIAERLDAAVHIISADKKRLDIMNALLRELGFEHGGEPVFSGIASVYGALTADEREKGAFLLDFGAGACSYSVIYAEGVLLSGVLPVGTDNVANDLSVGLELPFEFCRDFLRNGRLAALRNSGANSLEYAGKGIGRVRRIPLDSFEKIIDLRLREIASILLTELRDKHLPPLLQTGIVLCGGGAMLPGAVEIFRDVTGLHVRVGEPSGITGAMTSFDYAPSCYTAILGLLKYAILLDADSSDLPFNGLRDAFAGVTDSILGTMKKVLKF